jgi:hypothetical protein
MRIVVVVYIGRDAVEEGYMLGIDLDAFAP